MTPTITLPPEAEEKLRQRAAQAGQTIEGFVCALVAREVLRPNDSESGQRGTRPVAATFDEIFAPLRKEVEESGISEPELECLLEQAREEVWMERKATQGKDS